MIRNHVTLAFRTLARQKVFSFINIAGLAVGLASALVILLWVQDELGYDHFHSNADRTYRLTAAASNLEVAISPAPVAPALQELIPGIRNTVRLMTSAGAMFEAGDQKFEETKGFYTEPSFFQVFDFRLAQGDTATALIEPNSVILSPELAVKYFGTVDALGKTIVKGGHDNMTVTGILAPSVANSHLHFDFLLPWSYAATRDYNIKNNSWGNFDFFTYITFQEKQSDAQIAELEKKIDELYMSHETSVIVTFKLQPLTDIHLHSRFMADVKGHGSAQYVAALSIIAVFILVIGCINFMNLATARAARRAKEVGLRKVAGAIRWQLISQFLGESIVVTSISLVLAILLVVFGLPVVNNLVGKQLAIDFLDPFTVGTILAIATLTGVLSGIYPAFVLSSYRPVSVLKNETNTGSAGATFRNILVSAQFIISIVLLAGTTIVYRQLEYMRSKDLGFEKDNLLYMKLHGDVDVKKINSWRTALEANPATALVTISDGIPANHVSGTADVRWQGKDPQQQVMFAMLRIDEQFLRLYNMELASGRNFHPELRGDSANFILNQTAVKIMGWTDETAIGQVVTRWNESGTVVGVVKDFNFKPLQEAIEPIILSANTWGGTIVIKAQAGMTAQTIEAMEGVWNRLDQMYPFSYGFVDQDLENLYASDRQVGTLFTVFATLAIVISCLGLYGLSAFVTIQRTREIGIRKALGASVLSIIYLLNRRFALPVIVAMVIASPLAYLAMNRWLEGFAYKISFNWGFVVVAGGVALIVSLLTVSYETVKAARENPVKALRSE